MKVIILFAVLVLFVGLGCVQPIVQEPEIKCNDSEAGADIHEFGYVTYNGLTYNDSCQGDSKVVEYYCRGDELQSEVQDCPFGYICSEGACITVPCEDTDEGNDIYEKGTVTKGEEEYTDYCIDNSVVEYYCANNEINSIVSGCPDDYSCSDGACVLTVCEDTEDGRDVSVAGTVTKDNKSYTDYCFDSEQVVEYYCKDDGEVASTYISCSSGYVCSGGVCTASTGCIDSDLGQEKYTKGTISKGTTSYEDYCFDGDTVKEYYCSGGEIYWNYLDCLSGYGCSNGRCVYTGLECDDTDDGQDRYEKGTVTGDGDTYTDYCLDDDTVREYYCSGDEVSYKSLGCPSGYECSDGKCISAICSDSDGNDVYIYGHVTKGASTYNDYCLDSTNVREYWCDGNDVESTTYECPGGYVCSSGKCVVGCTDTDGGTNEFVYGTVFHGDFGFSDICVDTETVKEYYCVDAFTYSHMPIGCGFGYACSAGVCIPQCEDTDEMDHKTVGTTKKGTIERTDVCVDMNTVREYYCHGNEIYSMEIDCVDDTTFCDAGQCIFGIPG